MNRSREQIRNDIVEMIQELMQDWDPTVRLDADTGLFSKLEFDSLTAVVLCTAIQERYKRPMPFAALFADVGQRPVRDLSIGELSDFVQSHLDPGS